MSQIAGGTPPSVPCEPRWRSKRSKSARCSRHIFEGSGGGPGNTYTWVELKDDLTVSLLQARLIQLNLPINVKIAGALGDSA